MIKADPGWVAQYTRTEGEQVTRFVRPIVAWTDEGAPRVVEPQSGHLVAPEELGRGEVAFDGVTGDDDTFPYIGVLPAQGWFLRTRNEAGPDFHDMPVVGFAVRANGGADILTGGSDGIISINETPDGEKVRLNPPGGWDALPLPADADSQWLKPQAKSRAAKRLRSSEVTMEKFRRGMLVIAEELCQASPTGIDIETLSEFSHLPVEFVRDRLERLEASSPLSVKQVRPGFYRSELRPLELVGDLKADLPRVGEGHDRT